MAGLEWSPGFRFPGCNFSLHLHQSTKETNRDLRNTVIGRRLVLEVACLEEAAGKMEEVWETF